MAKISSGFSHFFALKKRLFFDDFFRQKMTFFSLHFLSIFFKNTNIVKLDISRIFHIFFFVFFTFFFPKNRHIFLRFFALKNVIFFTLKNAKKNLQKYFILET